MLHQREKLPSPSEPVSLSSNKQIFRPEPSEEPNFSKSNLSPEEKTRATQEHRGSSELNSSSLQISTQQSLNLKHSFSINSPKRSIPSTPYLLGSKVKSLQGQNLSMRLNEKLKELEEDSRMRRSQEARLQKLSEVDGGKPLYTLPNPAVETEMVIEGEKDEEIPILKWCAHCKGEVLTEVQYVNNRKTFWASVGILMSGGVLGCFLLPYMTNHCKGIKLICHKCRRSVG